MGLLDYAKEEMELFNGENVDDMQQLVTKNILELITVFAKQGHSGSSAPYVLNLFNKLARWEPLMPITFEENQWNKIGQDEFQHKRNSAVFKKGKDGKPYYTYAYAKCWESKPDSCWSGSLLLKNNKRVGRCYIKDSTKMPKIKILIPLEYNNGGGDWEFKVVDESAIEELKEYYDVEIKDMK